MEGRFFHEKKITWREIARLAEQGRARELLEGGERFAVEPEEGEPIPVEAAFDEQDRLFFVYRRVTGMTPQRVWPEAEWKEFPVRRLAAAEFRRFPETLRKLCVPQRLYDPNGEHATLDMLFPLAAVQISGEDWTSTLDPGWSQLNIFRDTAARVRPGAHKNECWWTRTVYSDRRLGVCVTDAGEIQVEKAHRLMPTCLAFCLN